MLGESTRFGDTDLDPGGVSDLFSEIARLECVLDKKISQVGSLAS
jgi:hypothetical protein